MSIKNWRLEPKIKCLWSSSNIVIIPTIVYYPEKERYPGHSAVVIAWLGFYIGFGEWKYKEE